MKKIIPHFLIICLAMAFLVSSGTGLADNGKSHKQHKGSGTSDEGFSWPDILDGKTGIKTNDRDVIKSYIKKKHGKNCPPGLAKKNNGCLPPGIAKKYNVGQPLPDNVSFSSLPAELLKLLSPAPRGHKYVQVDKDILLLDKATQTVIDAVTLLSAVGN